MEPFLLLSLFVAPPVFVFALIATAWKILEALRYRSKLRALQDSRSNSEKESAENKRYLTVPRSGPVHIELKHVKTEGFVHFISLAFFFRSVFHLTHLPKIVINGPDKFVV